MSKVSYHKSRACSNKFIACVPQSTAYRGIVVSLEGNYSNLADATKSSSGKIAAQLFSKRLISESTRDAPTCQNIISEVKAILSLTKDYSELKYQYELFLECLTAEGGPAQFASDVLKAEWESIQQQCEPIVILMI